MDVLLLDQDAVAPLIDPRELLDELADGFRSLSAGAIVAPTHVEVAVEKGFSLSMPAYRPGGHIGVKVVNVFEGNESLGLPSHMALIGLFDAETGACVAVILAHMPGGRLWPASRRSPDRPPLVACWASVRRFEREEFGSMLAQPGALMAPVWAVPLEERPERG
jgi:Ornithine cyclodeaminase/mu-crystallin family